jgi:hypothetical protein
MNRWCEEDVEKRPKFEERLWNKISPEPNSGCWLWTGHTNIHGYGVSWTGSRTTLAHRVTYNFFVGPVPDGHDLDHLCRVRCCVNPAHLEPVTRRVNWLRSNGPQLCRERYEKQTHCKHGHAKTPDNVFIINDGSGYKRRKCKTCILERAKAKRRAEKNDNVDKRKSG